MAFQDGGARALMASYNAWNGVPMAVNPVLQSLVIDQWGADVISSDGGAVTNLVKLYKRYPTQEAAVAATLKAGINQYLDTYKDGMRAALKDGLVAESDLDAALARKFRVTLRLGLLDPPARNPYAKIGTGPEPWTTDADKAVAKQIALESITLLKNTDNALPLDRTKLRAVAVVGPLADSVHWDWYGGLPPYAVTPLDGIRAALGPGVKVVYAEGGDAAVAAAKGADVVIAVVGNDPTCGPNMAHDWTDAGTKPCADPGDGREGRDRETLSLAQEGLVQRVMAVNPRTVMVLVSSFPYTIDWSQAHVPAILHTVHASQEEGTAIAAVLFGDYNPGGHLTETWPASMDQLPPMMDYDIRHGRTYMYFDRGHWGKPLYPFGYGLSYAAFRFDRLRLSAPVMAKDGAITVSLDVTNTGKVAGDAVPQLYVRHLKSAVPRPELELEGFRRVHLAPGETKTVEIPLKAAQLAYWSAPAHGFVVESEPVQVMIGASSADIALDATVTVK
jgi:beta-glucosidase